MTKDIPEIEGFAEDFKVLVIIFLAASIKQTAHSNLYQQRVLQQNVTTSFGSKLRMLNLLTEALVTMKNNFQKVSRRKFLQT